MCTIHVDSKGAALVDTTIQMARNLELNVIAEGVETLEQLAFLKARRCKQAQGYYFQKPLLPEKIAHARSSVSWHALFYLLSSSFDKGCIPRL